MRILLAIIRKYFTFKIFLTLIKVASFVFAVAILAMSFGVITQNMKSQIDPSLDGFIEEIIKLDRKQDIPNVDLGAQ